MGWPSAAHKQAIKTHIKNVSGFSGCLGAGDGSLVNFDEIPNEDGAHFLSRKKCFGVLGHRFETSSSVSCKTSERM
jgi:hypothetical protein